MKLFDNFDEYRRMSERTLSPGKYDYQLGLIGELGEITELVKKFLYHGHPLEREKWCRELGDLMFYIAAEATRNNLTLKLPEHEEFDQYERPSLGVYCKEASHHITTYITYIGWGLLVDAAAELTKLLAVIDKMTRWPDRFGLSLDEVMQTNVEKLRSRYPEGFTHAASLQRPA